MSLLLYFVLSPAPAKNLMADSTAGAEHTARSDRAVLRKWPLWTPRKLPCDLEQNEGRKRMNDPLHCSALIFVIGTPKQHCLSPDSHIAITIMWHLITHKVFPNIFSYFSSLTQVLLQINHLSIMIRIDTYKTQPTIACQNRIVFLSHANRKPRSTRLIWWLHEHLLSFCFVIFSGWFPSSKWLASW